MHFGICIYKMSICMLLIYFRSGFQTPVLRSLSSGLYQGSDLAAANTSDSSYADDNSIPTPSKPSGSNVSLKNELKGLLLHNSIFSLIPPVFKTFQPLWC